MERCVHLGRSPFLDEPVSTSRFCAQDQGRRRRPCMRMGGQWADIVHGAFPRCSQRPGMRRGLALQRPKASGEM